jgi:TetR/AcrR family transcriptional repressor of bet genes
VSPRKKKAVAAPRAPRARNGHSRQRQRLIDACISALHIYGPSRTTVEKVVAIAKMSPGIVRFYFESKAAMLVASLQFLAAEFEEQVLVPVSKLKSKPVAALEMMVDLYLDPEIASPRKVSVWYAFWGEASSRQEYYDICGQKDESFAALVRELIGRLIEETHQPHLDPGGIALGLIGVLEMLWQDFAFQSEGNIDRQAAKRRCMAYLRSIFPGQFSSSAREREDGPAAGAVNRFPGWAYCNSFAFAMERDRLFQGAAQIAGHESQIPRAGDYLAADIGAERALLVRDSAGRIHALRNSCPQQPHALVNDGGGRFEGGAIDCKVHGLKFTLEGRRADAGGRFDLSALELQASGGLLFVRSPQTARSSSLAPATGSMSTLNGLLPLGPAAQVCVAADWKVLIEQWLETVALEGTPAPSADSIAWTFRPGTGAPTWSSKRYLSLAGSGGNAAWQERFIAPNQLLQSRPDGVSILQVLPTGPGRSLLRRFDFTLCAGGASARALQYVASRLRPLARRGARAIAESVQTGMVDFGYQAAARGPVPPALAWFRRELQTRVPALALDRPPPDY